MLKFGSKQTVGLRYLLAQPRAAGGLPVRLLPALPLDLPLILCHTRHANHRIRSDPEHSVSHDPGSRGYVQP